MYIICIYIYMCVLVFAFVFVWLVTMFHVSRRSCLIADIFQESLTAPLGADVFGAQARNSQSSVRR